MTRLLASLLLLAIACGCIGGCVHASGMPPPFTRQLDVQTPPLTGTDVLVLQNLLVRGVPSTPLNDMYDAATAAAVKTFQTEHGLSVDGIVGPITAQRVLDLLSNDGYVDNGLPASAYGKMYKVHIPVRRNRSIETTATLYDANNTILFQYTVRTHGHDQSGSNSWPTFNSSGDGLNMFSSDGNTPTGLMSFDLNSPEPLPKLFGPYPINRAVLGLEGNAKFLMPHVRNGILQHTGEWPGWSPPMPMPNSDGCIHAFPGSIEKVWKLLVGLGVKVRKNPFGTLPYPFEPQGLLSVELID